MIDTGCSSLVGNDELVDTTKLMDETASQMLSHVGDHVGRTSQSLLTP